MTAGIPVWRLGSLTNSEVAAVFRAAARTTQRDHDMAVFLAWRTATLSRARKIPKLARLLRPRKRRSAAEQAAIRADIAAAEAEFARLEAEAATRSGASRG